MQLKTIQWNIGGAFIRTPGDDPTKSSSYSYENLSYVTQYLEAHSPDIITLQETHADETDSQAKYIAEQLGFPYFYNDPYDTSHIDTSKQLCQSIISRFPIKEHFFSLFFNPKYQKEREDGTELVSHNKGISTAVIDVAGTELIVQTLHLIPFQLFNADLENDEGKKLRESISAAIEKEKTPYLLQGDFNYVDIEELIPDIFSKELHELAGDTPTTPKENIYDHIFFRGLLQDASPLIDSRALTDHYPIVSVFEIQQ